jgi:hypothetical protein
MLDLHKLIVRWESRFYTEPFMALCEITALVVGLVYLRHDKYGKLFILFIGIDFLILLLDFYHVARIDVKSHLSIKFLAITNPIISLLELAVYYYYGLKIISLNSLRLYLKISFPVFLVLLILFLTNSLDFLNIKHSVLSYFIGALEFLLLVPLCCVYYLELFKRPVHTLFDHPSFWIITGIFLYSCISIPFYLFMHFIRIDNYREYMFLSALLFDLPFAINFLFLSRAFICKKPLTI